jgi:hypothetical protein
MVKEGKEMQLVKLIQRVIDPYRDGLVLRETEDGFITNGHWAVKKELMEPSQYSSYVRGVIPLTVRSALEKMFKKDEEEEVERNVAFYDDFHYYAERIEVISRRKLRFYILDVPVLFRKVMVLKNYVDFIEALTNSMYGSEVKRRLYYVEILKKDGVKEWETYFVWYREDGGNDDVIAVCMGCACSD